jgi:MarR family transcriptional regulator, 2-MHQ and catechol-resistance regulon repressor
LNVAHLAFPFSCYYIDIDLIDANPIDVNASGKDSDGCQVSVVQSVSGVHLWLILLKAFHSIADLNVKRLEATGLGESDFRVLEVLLHKGPMPVNAIGPKVFLTPGSISTAVERLHRKGLVTRSGCEQDRRIRTVALTAKGRNLIRRIFDAHAEEMEQLASVLSPGERAQLAESLKKLGKHAAATER